MSIIIDYLATLESNSTYQAYQEDLKDFTTWFENTNGQEIEPAIVTGIDIRDYKSYLISVRGLKPATVNRRLAAIKSWLKWARDHKMIDDLPRFPRRAAVEVKQAPKALTKVEESRLIRTVERLGSDRDKALIALLLYAGLRVGEAVMVRADDIEIGDRKGKVIVRAGKGQKRREIPLSADARGMIKPLLSKSSGWLFGGSAGHLTPRAAQQIVKKYVYLAMLDIKAISPHTLRHTFATRLLRSGVDIVIVAALLGHSRLDTTARYTQPGWHDLEQAVEV